MEIRRILEYLKEQRDAINAAISILQGNRRKQLRAHPAQTKTAPPKPRRKLSAAARKRISDAAKARWAKARSAGKNAL